MSKLENHGLIIREVRKRSELSVRDAAKKINRSIGWLSEIENGTGTARLTEPEFERILNILNGSKFKAQFKTWIAKHKNQARGDRTFDGAVLKYIRIKKQMTMAESASSAGISISYLSKLESGHKPVSPEIRDKIMKTLG